MVVTSVTLSLNASNSIPAGSPIRTLHAGGAYSACPDPLAAFKGPCFWVKWVEEKKREG